MKSDERRVAPERWQKIEELYHSALSSFAFCCKRQPGWVPIDPVRWRVNAQRAQSPAPDESRGQAPSKPFRDMGSATRPFPVPG